MGFVTNIGDFSTNVSFQGQKSSSIKKTYVQDWIKQSLVNYDANELKVTFADADNRKPEKEILKIKKSSSVPIVLLPEGRVVIVK